MTPEDVKHELLSEYFSSEVTSGEMVLFIFNQDEYDKLFKDVPNEIVYRGASLFLEWDFEDDWERIEADGTQEYITGESIPEGETIGHYEPDDYDRENPYMFEWVKGY